MQHTSGFLAKEVLLLGAAVWSAGEALIASATRRAWSGDALRHATRLSGSHASADERLRAL